jgi:hypothetical protein
VLTRKFPSVALRLLFTACFFLSVLKSEAAILIDDFSVGPITLSRTGATPATATQTGLDPAHVLGGSRDIAIGYDGGAVQTLTIDTTVGELVTSSAPSLAYYRIRYGSEANPLHLNLGSGADRAILVEATDLPAPTIVLISAGANASVGPNHVGVTQRSLPVGTAYLISMSVFQNYNFGAFDPTAITSIQIFAVRQSGTARLTRISIVPEPGCAALLACAGIAFGRPMRREWIVKQHQSGTNNR